MSATITSKFKLSNISALKLAGHFTFISWYIICKPSKHRMQTNEVVIASCYIQNLAMISTELHCRTQKMAQRERLDNPA